MNIIFYFAKRSDKYQLIESYISSHDLSYFVGFFSNFCRFVYEVIPFLDQIRFFRQIADCFGTFINNVSILQVEMEIKRYKKF